MKELTITEQMPKKTEHCAKHGDYVSKNYLGGIWSKCPSCATIEHQQRQAEAEKREREEKRADWARKVGQAGIPDRYRDRTLLSYFAETPGQQRALEFATNYADNFDQVIATGRSALFIGKPGTGKNHLAIGIGLRIMNRDGRTVLFTTVMRAIRRVKDTWGRESRETESEAIAALTFPDLLILDEIGVQFGSETEKLILFDILNERYEKRKPTILISNEFLDVVRAYLGGRIFDRLREDGGEVVVFDWESYRGRA